MTDGGRTLGGGGASIFSRDGVYKSRRSVSRTDAAGQTLRIHMHLLHTGGVK